MAEEAAVCIHHPDRTTLVRCQKCGAPICPDCYVYTPVGIRCEACAQLTRSPVYQVEFRHLLAASLTGAALALGGGFLWALWPEFSFWIGLALAFLVAEGVHRAAGRRRGRDLQLAAVLSLGFAWVVSRVVQILLFVLETGWLSPSWILRFLTNPWHLAILILGGVIAWRHLA